MSAALDHPDLPDAEACRRDAVALAALARDCAASGVERQVLHLRFSRLPADLRGARHRLALREALAPLLRPTRARLFDLPGGDMVALCPPPGEPLLRMRDTLSRLLPEQDAAALMPLLRLPQEGAALLAAVEAALGLMEAAPHDAALIAPLPLAEPAMLAAALGRLAHADLTAHLRRRGVFRLPQGGTAEEDGEELRVDAIGLAALLLPGRAPCPDFRLGCERRMLAGLADPRELRSLPATTLPLQLAALSSDEFLRLEGLLGAARPRLSVCVPAAEALEDPAGFALWLRLAARRGWVLGLDDVAPELLAAMPLAGLPLLRLRHAPGAGQLDAEGRAALDRHLPKERERLVLLGTDAPSALAWGWHRGLSRFVGRLLPRR